MSYLVVVGYEGRMATELQKLLPTKNLDYRVYSKKAPAEIQVADFKEARAVIDFSSPAATKEIVKLAVQSGTPLLSGTTGWDSDDDRDACFAAASQAIPILWDSNFSLGIEILCRAAEEAAKGVSADFFVSDFHHKHKLDSPSGTALKIAERIQSINPDVSVHFRDYRLGEIPGEHRILISWEDETLEFSHRAQSRRAFAAGAIQAAEWLCQQKKGFYRMKDLLSSNLLAETKK